MYTHGESAGSTSEHIQTLVAKLFVARITKVALTAVQLEGIHRNCKLEKKRKEKRLARIQTFANVQDKEYSRWQGSRPP